ncbi:glycosyltransferase [Niabella insulamsoli]|uniref:glycosyltransferase n=1 Tax=Niabella insulamsoli TaxID=3144874 RepID=UPI0031FDF28F
MKEKITFVALRYGLDVNGGAEVHCRMLAERLSDTYNVEVLTSRIKNYKTLEQEYAEGAEVINNVTVKRFSSRPFDQQVYNAIRKRAKWSRKLRRMIYRLRMDSLFFNLFPVWNFGVKNDAALLRVSEFYSEDLLQYLKVNHSASKALIFFSYVSPYTFFGSQIAPEKSVIIPTIHYHEGGIFHSIYSHLFSNVGHIAFNSVKEQALAKKIFTRSLAPNSVVAVGVDIAPAAPVALVKEKYDLPEKYALYFGRVCESKMNDLVPYFIAYKHKYGGDLKLVLTGGVFMPKNDHPDILYTGFVTESEKTTLIENATVVINPSKSESLSLLLLEAMKLGKTALVNADCPVLKQHCLDSDFAAQYYESETDFVEKLNVLASAPGVLEENSIKAKNYVENNYAWDLILSRLKAVINQL